MNPTRKVGRITVAAGLVAFGVGLLLDNLGLYGGVTSLILKLWPVLLIGFGLEYLYYTTLGQRDGEEHKLRFDGGGTFLLALILLAVASVSAFRTWVVPHFGQYGISLDVGPGESRSDSRTVSLGDAKSLHVDVRVGTIVLQEAPGTDTIKVDATYTVHGVQIGGEQSARDLLGQINLDVTEGDTIGITADIPSNLRNVSIQYTIYAPSGLKVDASTGAGTINVSGYTGEMMLNSNVGRIEVENGGGSLNARSGSGQIRVSHFDGPVDAKTNAGSLEMRETTGAVQLESGTGTINVRNHWGGKLVAETNTGRIDVSLDAPLEGDLILKTKTGSVSLRVPEQSSMRATAQTRTGGVDVPSFMSVSRVGTGHTATGTRGDGKYTVSLEAGTGSVHFSLD
ncbi:MAG TPA: DUF4097 family beta strand repeat-containing protein [Symbiobacteriaceae bacterium]|nr:DUF4097 family beta strand repeat-containing protein [Symbiobacteriaceae bacterium]